MRHLLTLSALAFALAACSTHVPQSPAQPPVATPTLPACQLVTVQERADMVAYARAVLAGKGVS